MVSIQSVLAIIFFVLMFGFLILKRKKLAVQKVLFPLIYIVMYRTTLGLRFMDKCARKVPFLGYIIGAGAVIGFLGMVFICFELIRNSIALITSPDAAVSVQPVLPFEAKGVFFVPFIYWILAIFIIATVHEFWHGVASRYFGLKLRSSGFAFLCLILPVIPAAFVEPDEVQLARAKLRRQLGIFAAGPFSNIATAGIILLIVMFIFNPIGTLVFEPAGVKVVSVTEEGPSSAGGLLVDDIITGLNGMYIPDVKTFVAELKKYHPKEAIRLKTSTGLKMIVLGANPKDASLPWLGITSRPYSIVKQSFAETFGSNVIPGILEWIFGFFYWLFLLSLGIGLFNLLPMGPLDGGLMLKTVLAKYYKKRGLLTFRLISVFFLVLIFANLTIGFVR